MGNGLAKTGIDVLGSVPWGTHFCQVYHSTQDLLDILAPYFRTGLESNEYCIWITKSPQDSGEIMRGLKRLLGDITKYKKTGQLEVASYEDIYFRGGVFDPQRVLNDVSARFQQALSKGYSGLRIAGEGTWLAKTNWEKFIEYEKQVDDAIHNSRALALCVFLFDLFSTTELIEIMRTHGSLLLKRGGEWISLEHAPQHASIGQMSPLQRWFLKAGTEGLNDQEMIELLLSAVLPSAKVDKLLKKSLTRFKNLRAFLAASSQELERAGIPMHAVLGIKLLHELPSEILRQRIMEKPAYTSSKEIFDYLYYSMRDLKTEVFKVIFLNSQAQIIEIADLYEGAVDRIPISPRQIIESALRHGTSALVFVHNHPTGNPTPSRLDKQLTRDLVFAGMVLEIRVLDHIIIGHNRYFSFADEGLIKDYELDYLKFKLKSASKRKRAPRKRSSS